MRLIFEYEQVDGKIDGLAAKAAFESALNTAGHRSEFDKANSKTVMRVMPHDVDLDNFRVQQTVCSLKLSFKVDPQVTSEAATFIEASEDRRHPFKYGELK